MKKESDEKSLTHWSICWQSFDNSLLIEYNFYQANCHIVFVLFLESKISILNTTYDSVFSFGIVSLKMRSSQAYLFKLNVSLIMTRN